MSYARRAAVACAMCLLMTVACGREELADTDITETDSPIVRGTTQNGRNYVMELRFEYNSFDLATGKFHVGFCSGVLFAPRVVLTAAHCFNPPRIAADGSTFYSDVTRIIAYVGNNYVADLNALTTAGNGTPAAAVPPPPAASRFMLADSWETHPSWNIPLIAPDLAVVYLDRQPRIPPNTIVDPLPVGRTRLGASVVGQPITIVGYGASRALSADTQQNEGAFTKRQGTSPFVGAPVTNPLPPHPHPGLGNAAVRDGLMQLNGTAPNANACVGDSGGPAIRNVGGQDYVFGISSWGGDFCESFSYYTRLDPQLPFVDQSYKKGGQETLIPRTECIVPRTGGGFRAYFGYNNKNGINFDIPYGTSNSFAQDTGNLRPTHFTPGNHDFLFGVSFNAGQSLTWRLSPTNSPTTTLTVNQNSPRCSANNRGAICAQSCDAQIAAACGQSFEECVGFCKQTALDIPTCATQWDGFNRCQATLPPSAFQCSDGFPFPTDNGVCQPQFDAFLTCLFGG